MAEYEIEPLKVLIIKKKLFFDLIVTIRMRKEFKRGIWPLSYID